MALSDIPCLINPTHSLSKHCFDPSDKPALPLYILPSCLATPHHRFHFPSEDQPLRIQIEGPLLALQKLLPGVSWHVSYSQEFPLPGGPKLAELAFREIYHRDIQPNVDGDMVIRDEYKGWLIETTGRPIEMIDYYGVTFDHLVPPDDTNPEVLQINIIEIEDDEGPMSISITLLRSTQRSILGRRCLLFRGAVRSGEERQIGKVSIMGYYSGWEVCLPLNRGRSKNWQTNHQPQFSALEHTAIPLLASKSFNDCSNARYHLPHARFDSNPKYIGRNQLTSLSAHNVFMVYATFNVRS